MFVVIEGLDRTGKTTLAKQLQESVRFLDYVHFNKPERHPLEEYVKPLDVGALPHAVFDRYHWGEAVWPHVFHRPTDYDEEMLYYTELALESRGAVMVLTRREPEEIIRACREDGEDLQGAQQVRIADGLFGIAATHSILPVMEYHWRDDHWPIIGEAQARHWIASMLIEDTPRWVGFMQPNVLLVGDEVGPGSQGWTLPFVPYPNTSGHFLMRELIIESPRDRFAGGFEGCVKPAIVNSKTPDGYLEHVENLWIDLGAPPIVALGGNASKRLRTIGLKHEKLPHPQWWRRFNRKAGEGAYVRAIKEAAKL